MTDRKPTAWDTIKLNLSRINWRDFLLFMFAPMVILQISSLLKAGIIGVYISLGWLIIAAVISYLALHTVSMFAIITFIMISTQAAAGFLEQHHPFFALVPSLDNTLLGLVFIGSMLRPRPFVMSLVGKETIQRTEEKFGKSKYFFKAWFDINIIWGMFYILQGLLISYTMILQVETGKLLDFLLGWPAVLVMLYISVDYPQRYWTKNWEKMKVEIEAAKEYESRTSQG